MATISRWDAILILKRKIKVFSQFDDLLPILRKAGVVPILDTENKLHFYQFKRSEIQLEQISDTEFGKKLELIGKKLIIEYLQEECNKKNHFPLICV